MVKFRSYLPTFHFIKLLCNQTNINNSEKTNFSINWEHYDRVMNDRGYIKFFIYGNRCYKIHKELDLDLS